ncbi:protein of unknown function [Tenacibaculum aestuariivivum]
MALFAKTNSKITITGKNIPIPFFETEASPDNVSDRYINMPNKRRFINMFNRPRTNCNFLFLNKNKVTIDNKAEIKNNKGQTFSNKVFPDNKSIAYITLLLFTLVQRLKIKVNAPEIIPAINRYIDCFLCIIFYNR